MDEQIRLTGDASGAQKAYKQAGDAASQWEQKTAGAAGHVTGLAGKIGGFFAGIAKIGTVLAASGTGAAKFGGAVGTGVGLAASSFLKLNPVVGLLSSVGGALLGTVSHLAGVSDQAQHFGKHWQVVQNQLARPFANIAAVAFRELDRVLQSPGVQVFIKHVVTLITVVLNSLIPAIHAAASAAIAFFTALGQGDFGGALGKAVDAFKTGWQESAKGGGKQAGLTAGASFTQGFGEAVKSGGGGGGKSGGPLRSIGDLGTAAINALLAGFKKADFSALQGTAAAIQTALQTQFEKGNLAETAIVPRLIGSQTVVARALADMRQAGGLTDAILARVRAGLQGLGQPTQDFVEATLRGVAAQRQLDDATKQLEAAQEALKAKSTARQQIEQELADAQARQADRLKELIPLQDALTADQLALQQLEASQEPQRHRLNDIATESRDLEAEIARLEADQAAQLRELEPLRQKVADAAEAQHQAELRVKAAQADLLPLQDQLRADQEALQTLTAQQTADEKAYADAVTQSQAALSDLNQEISDREAASQRAIEDAQAAEQTALDAQQAQLDAIDARYADQIAQQQKIIDLVNEKWRAELEGAQKALDAANKQLALAERANRKQLLQFAVQRDAAQGINDPNKRIAALAQIDRAERQFTSAAAPRLDRLRLEQQVQADQLATTQDQRDAEKQGATDTLAALQVVIAAEKKVVQDRIVAIKAENDTRIKSLQAAAAIQKRADQDAQRAAQARATADQKALKAQRDAHAEQRKALDERVAADQKGVDAQQKIIDGLQRQADAAARTTDAAQTDLGTAEQIVHKRTDGAIAERKLRLDSLTLEKTEIQTQLDDQTAALHQRIDDEQAALDLKQGKLAQQADLEQRPIKDRLDAAQREETLAQRVVDARQLIVDSAQQLVDKYKDAADLAQQRLDTEKQNADAIDQQRQLLDQIAQNKGAGADTSNGPAPDFGDGGGAPPPPDPKATQDALDGIKKIWDLFWWGLGQIIASGIIALKKDWDQFWHDLPGKIEQFNSDAKAFVEQAATTVGGWAGDAIQKVKDTWDRDWVKVTGAVADGIDAVKQTWDRDWEKVHAAWSSFTTDLGKTWDGFWTGVGTKLDQAGSSVKTTWDGLTGGLRTGWSSFTGDAKATWDGFWAGVGTKAGEARDSIIGTVTGLRDRVGQAVSDLRDGAIAKVNEWRDGAVKGAQDLRDGALKAVSDFKDGALATLGGLVTDAGTKAGDIASGVIGGIASLATTGLDRVRGAIGTLLDSMIRAGRAALGIPDNGGDSNVFGTVAKSLVDGLIHGLQNAWHFVTDKVHELAMLIPQPIRDALNIKSPSGVTEDQGEFIGKGLEGGLENAKAGVAAAAAGLAQAVVDALAGLGALIQASTAEQLPIWQGWVAAVLAIVMTFFGPVDQDGTFLNWMFRRGDGWMQRWEDLVRQNLEFVRLEVWQNSFIILSNETLNILTKLRESLSVAAASIGQALGLGIIAGLQSTFAQIAEAGKAAVDTAMGAANAAAGNPHSPAPRFVPLGHNIGWGVAAGIDRAIGLVTHATRGLVEGAARVTSGAGPLLVRAAGGLSTFGTVALPRTPALAYAPSGAPAGPAAPAPGNKQNIFNIGTQIVHEGTPDRDLAAQQWHSMVTG
jgi:hypothetical protein